MMPAKKTIFLLGLAVLLLVGLFYVFSNFTRVQKYFEQQKLESEVEEMERPYREDTYGGETPEETYALFIEALKEGNIELAAKYFSPKRQAEWLKELEAQKEQNTLGEFIASLPDLNTLEKDVINDERIEFSYIKDSPEQEVELQGKKFNIPAGPSTYSIVFLKNTFTNKWKIEIL